MLPKINDKVLREEILPYNMINNVIMSKRISENNISKLKMLKEFLEEDQYENVNEPLNHRKKIASECKVRVSLEPLELRKLKGVEHKENNLKINKSYKESSITTETNTIKPQEKLLMNRYRSIF